MRQLALAALAAVFCLSAYGAHPNDTWGNIRMYRKVTKTEASHPIHRCFGPHGDIYAVELTDEFDDYLRNGPEFNEHRRGHGQGQGQGQPSAAPSPVRMAVTPPADTSWVMPVWAPRSSIITLTSTPGDAGYTWANFPAPGKMRWMFAKCADAAARQWSAQNTYVDEFVTLVRPDGSCENYTVYDVLLDKDSGCPGIGCWEQEMPDTPEVKGDWEFNLMYLHAGAGDNPSGATDVKWRPVYDYRDGKYRCYVHVP